LAEGKPQAGETVVVSGAAGAVGSIVAQIAKVKVLLLLLKTRINHMYYRDAMLLPLQEAKTK
jgi:D-arabinose 1-dehydrogenase-like Zn-dependent alcohol dehydrogenase